MKTHSFTILLTSDQEAQIAKEWNTHGQPGGVMLAQPRFAGNDPGPAGKESKLKIVIFDEASAYNLMRAVEAEVGKAKP